MLKKFIQSLKYLRKCCKMQLMESEISSFDIVFKPLNLDIITGDEKIIIPSKYTDATNEEQSTSKSHGYGFKSRESKSSESIRNSKTSDFSFTTINLKKHKDRERSSERYLNSDDDSNLKEIKYSSKHERVNSKKLKHVNSEKRHLNKVNSFCKYSAAANEQSTSKSHGCGIKSKESKSSENIRKSKTSDFNFATNDSKKHKDRERSSKRHLNSDEDSNLKKIKYISKGERVNSKRLKHSINEHVNSEKQHLNKVNSFVKYINSKPLKSSTCSSGEVSSKKNKHFSERVKSITTNHIDKINSNLEPLNKYSEDNLEKIRYSINNEEEINISRESSTDERNSIPKQLEQRNNRKAEKYSERKSVLNNKDIASAQKSLHTDNAKVRVNAKALNNLSVVKKRVDFNKTNTAASSRQSKSSESIGKSETGDVSSVTINSEKHKDRERSSKRHLNSDEDSNLKKIKYSSKGERVNSKKRKHSINGHANSEKQHLNKVNSFDKYVNSKSLKSSTCGSSGEVSSKKNKHFSESVKPIKLNHTNEANSKNLEQLNKCNEDNSEKMRYSLNNEEELNTSRASSTDKRNSCSKEFKQRNNIKAEKYSKQQSFLNKDTAIGQKLIHTDNAKVDTKPLINLGNVKKEANFNKMNTAASNNESQKLDDVFILKEIKPSNRSVVKRRLIQNYTNEVRISANCCKCLELAFYRCSKCKKKFCPNLTCQYGHPCQRNSAIFELIDD